MFVELKQLQDLRLKTKRREAHKQMQERFKDLGRAYHIITYYHNTNW